jgi:hypothetical protein
MIVDMIMLVGVLVVVRWGLRHVIGLHRSLRLRIIHRVAR